MEMLPFYNIFNEWCAAQTSKKIRAVWQSKSDNGECVSATVAYGYKKSPDNPKQWIIDEPAAKVVRYIFQLCLEDLGVTKIARRFMYCGGCGSKLYFCAAKSVKEYQEFYRCSAYKENRGSCTIQFIRNVLLERIVLKLIREAAEYITEYEPEATPTQQGDDKAATAAVESYQGAETRSEGSENQYMTRGSIGLIISKLQSRSLRTIKSVLWHWTI